ncbi:LytR/AlgR family response regulator transcription factor [Paucibacter sp. DJ2R-2]|uniref:LytR/AlgR family response regulator transcription factor n=1 Tax=Paucibacter sp. DJ2R-2 TaxID=2893558 RepID=UPI0021E4BEE7|nr:LytTR family DNA-binding domain-containing protein [Paucibacter sp. DJ2R-2]MCV2422579.1 LytTR family DNA-binding domain-containing protein [Paucibacter sp. DJ4R-1]MCV2438777.1 LytTR family DNA-binding domain-containing protein [Paucibacter sp. DJ2R-2]
MQSAALTVFLVDDEPLARLRLRSLLEACVDPRAEVVAEAGSATQAQHWLRDHSCDLILLDVQMPGADGLQLADSLQQQMAQPPAIVFVTAHAGHALRAFELEAMDYLTKPVRRERLQAALTRVAQRLAERSAMQTFQATQPGELEPEQPVIVVSDRGRLIRVPLNEVLYLKAELKYLTLRTATQSLVMDGSLSELEPRLGERFLRVHRNALVAKSAVRQLERHAPSHASPDDGSDTQLGGLDLVNAEVADGWAVRIAHVNEWLSVSRRQVAAVREALADRGS